MRARPGAAASLAASLSGDLCDPEGDVVFMRKAPDAASDAVTFAPWPGLPSDADPDAEAGSPALGNDVVELQSVYVNDVIHAGRRPRTVRILVCSLFAYFRSQGVRERRKVGAYLFALLMFARAQGPGRARTRAATGARPAGGWGCGSWRWRCGSTRRS